MNVYDSERILEALDKKGITETKDSNESDLVIFNTCHIREKAAEKLYSDIGRLKKQNNTKKIVVVLLVVWRKRKTVRLFGECLMLIWS